MSSADRIDIVGLKEFQRQLRAMDQALPRKLRIVLNEAGQVIVDYDRANMPRVTGRAVGSVKLRSTQRLAQVAIGGQRAAYTPWLDFGGQGRVAGKPPPREFIPEGRYTYKGLRLKRDQITEIMEKGLLALGAEAGLEMT